LPPTFNRTGQQNTTNANPPQQDDILDELIKLIQ
jgi:hypothetical protein